MKKKNLTIILFAAVIFSILTLSFFYGSNNEVIPLSKEDAEQNISTIDEIDPSTDNENVDDSIVTEEVKENIQEKDEQVEEVHKEVEQEKVEEKEKADLPKDTQKELQKEEKTVEQKSKKELTEVQKEEKKQIIAEDKANSDKKDKYLTDPVPAGKPKPVEWQDVTIQKDQKLSISLSVTAKTILNNMHLFNQNKLEVLPADGVIYPKQTVKFYKGESVFDVLHREMKANKIHMEFEMTPIYNSHYIEGINNIYEFDCGELSGWMYRVNGWFPNYGASRYQLEDGDVVEWVYTCDLGRDIGGGQAATGGGQ